MPKYTIAVDFDGVIHRYDTPFIDPETIPDEAVEGAIEWLVEMSFHFNVVIFTTRARTTEGIRAVKEWLRARTVEAWRFDITAIKPAALMYIDDRAYRFDGTHFPTKDEIHKAKPWHKKGA